jgi:hypothetical protein
MCFVGPLAGIFDLTGFQREASAELKKKFEEAVER